MTTARRFVILLAFSLYALPTGAAAQTPSVSTVNVTSDEQQVRVSAVGDVLDMRVAVSDEAGDVVFEGGPVVGQALDWAMRDPQGQRVPAGAYTLTVTYRTSNGKLRRRVEQVFVTEDVTADGGQEKATAQAPAPAPAAPVDGAGTAGRIAKFTSPNQIGNSALFESGGKIGLGTTAPAQSLHVLGTAPRLRLQSPVNNALAATEYVNNANRVWLTGAGGSAAAGVASKFFVYDQTAAQYRLVVDTSGNVGIGVPAPASRLTVGGNVQIVGAGNGIKFADGSIQTKAIAGTINGTGTTNRLAKFTGPNSFGNSSITEVAGNVGIGTGSPTAGLHVRREPTTPSGTLALEGDTHTYLTFFPDGFGAGRKGYLGYAFDTTDNLTLANEVSFGDILLSTGILGNVGIGTTNPTDLLHVFGGSGGSARSVAARIEGGTRSCSPCIGGDGLYAVGGNGTGTTGFGGDGLVAFPGRGSSRANDGYAADLFGDVLIRGNLQTDGTKDFKIDHPLDPENKYLYHAAIESSEVLNVYSGNVTTDARGEAVVKLPDWFEAINTDPRYQLTVIGAFAQAVVAREVKGNSFSIKTSAPRVKVSWQVTAVRADAVMKSRPFKVEEVKPERERGTYLSPEAFGQPEEKGSAWARHPELMEQMRRQRAGARTEEAPPPNR